MRKIKFFLITLFLFSLLFGLLTFFFLLLSFHFYSKSSKPPKKPHKHYIFTEINFIRPTSNKGFVTLDSTLESEEYVSYLNENTGSTIIISNLGGRQYKCSGSCYCSSEATETNRRVTLQTSNLLTRSLSVLFTAFSASMALRIARATFDEQCIEHFLDICDPETPHIISEVDDCSDNDDSTAETEEVPKEDELGEHLTRPILDDSKEEVSFLCRGHCLSLAEVHDDDFARLLPGVTRDEYFRVGHKRVGLCEAMEFEREVTVERGYLYGDYIKNHPQVSKEFASMPPGKANDEARMSLMFAVEDLSDLCREASWLKKEWFSEVSQSMFEEYVQKEMDSEECPDWVKGRLEEWIEKRPFCFGFAYTARETKAERLELIAENVDCFRIAAEATTQ